MERALHQRRPQTVDSTVGRTSRSAAGLPAGLGGQEAARGPGGPPYKPAPRYHGRMKSVALITIAAALVLAQMAPKDRLARWNRVEMPFRAQAFSAKERQMVEKI